MSRAAFFHSDVTDAVEQVQASMEGHDPRMFLREVARMLKAESEKYPDPDDEDE